MRLPSCVLFLVSLAFGGPAEDVLRAVEAKDEEALKKLIARLDVLLEENGRDRSDFQIHVISMDAYSLDGIKRLEDLGVTDAIVGFRNAYEADTTSLQQKVDALKEFADTTISKFA